MKSEFKLIPLTQGKFAIVDAEDFEYLNQWKWSLTWFDPCGKEKRNFYAVRDLPKPAKRRVKMHRIIIGPLPKGHEVDHKNGNGLDNRRENLRVCSHKHNRWNSRMPRHNKSGFKGVAFHKRCNAWEAYVCPNGKKIHLGVFDCKLEAARAYNKAAIRHFGEFARLNPV